MTTAENVAGRWENEKTREFFFPFVSVFFSLLLRPLFSRFFIRPRVDRCPWTITAAAREDTVNRTGESRRRAELYRHYPVMYAVTMGPEGGGRDTL